MVELDEILEAGALAAPHLEFIRSIVTADIYETEMADRLSAYMNEHLNCEFAYVVFDLMSVMKIISKPKYRELMTYGTPVPKKDVDRYRTCL